MNFSALTRRHFLASAGALACGVSSLNAQDNDPTFTTEVKVVDVLATVRTKKGEIVRDLTKDDFELWENKRRQTIRYFAKQSDLPLTVGLMIDTSMSQQHVINEERGAGRRFLDQVLRDDVVGQEKDKLFIMQFDLNVMLRQPLTSSRRALEEVLPDIDTPTRRELMQQQGGGTLLFDAIVQASADVLKTQRNRKAMILMTDGDDNGSTATLSQAIDAAQRADTLVYSILFTDPGMFHGASDGAGNLRRLSKETGAGFFEVSKKQDINQIFALIEDELRSQYDLGFVSDQPVEISEFRTLALATKQKGLVVQARERYWAKR